MSTAVLCVMRSGGDYDSGHVARLAHQVRAHSPAGTPFVCLTDQPERVGHWCARPLQHDWPGWWAKIEALDVPGPCLYLDLDVTVVGYLGPLLDAAAHHDLMMSRDFWGMHPHGVNSSIMAWRGDVSALYREFASASATFMDLYKTKTRWGDQAFIRDTYAGEPTLWQDLLPGTVVSYKRGALLGEDASRCAVLVSHGRPRPWESGGADGWLRRAGRLAP